MRPNNSYVKKKGCHISERLKKRKIALNKFNEIIDKGGYPMRAPKFYENGKSLNGVPILLKTSNSSILEELFKYYLEEGITLDMLLSHSRELGYYFNIVQIKNMLSNKVYCGFIFNREKNLWKLGQHDALIDIVTFNRVNEKLKEE